MQSWQDEYPWLQLAFESIGPAGKAASDGWRVRIEDELKTTLDFKLRPDGTASVWCGMSGHDFHHRPTPKELLEGLADAYRREVKRVGGAYPTRVGGWKMSEAVSAHALSVPEALEPVAVETREGLVEISPEAVRQLLDEVRRRGRADHVVRLLEAGGTSIPLTLDREGKIVIFDALWALAERSEGNDLIDPQLHLLRNRLRDEIAGRPPA